MQGPEEISRFQATGTEATQPWGSCGEGMGGLHPPLQAEGSTRTQAKSPLFLIREQRELCPGDTGWALGP